MAFSANDVMALVRAGFSASQIELIGRELSTPSTESTPSTVPSTETPSPTVTVPVLSENPPPTQPAPQPPAYAAMGDIMAKIDALTKAVKAGAVRNDQQPGGGATPWSSEDIMAQIINPTYKKEG